MKISLSILSYWSYSNTDLLPARTYMCTPVCTFTPQDGPSAISYSNSWSKTASVSVVVWHVLNNGFPSSQDTLGYLDMSSTCNFRFRGKLEVFISGWSPHEHSKVYKVMLNLFNLMPTWLSKHSTQEAVFGTRAAVVSQLGLILLAHHESSPFPRSR